MGYTRGPKQEVVHTSWALILSKGRQCCPGMLTSCIGVAKLLAIKVGEQIQLRISQLHDIDARGAGGGTIPT